MLDQLFSPGEYRFQMKFRKGPIAGFYENTDQHRAITEERRKWLIAEEPKYFDLRDGGIPLVARAIAIAFPNALSESEQGLAPRQVCRLLAERVEPDFLLLGPNRSTKTLELCGGSVCFPSSWAFEEKIGHPIDFIHGPVPGLNDAIGEKIGAFMRSIRPGISWERTNWGLSHSPELNQHPSRKLLRLDEHTPVEEIFLRIEWQSLVALPPDGVLFGIRIIVHPFAELLGDPQFREGMQNALATMPDAMAVYKNVARARTRLLALLLSWG